MQGWRSSDCWRQTVQRPGGSDKKRSVTQWRPSSSWYDERWRTRWSQTLSGLHSSDLLKLVRTGWHLNTGTHDSLYWILSCIRSQCRSFNTGVMRSAFIAWQTKRAAVLMTAWSRFKSFAGRLPEGEKNEDMFFFRFDRIHKRDRKTDRHRMTS